MAEMATLKDEVSEKLPWIAEKASAAASSQWRKRAEEETEAVRVERDRRVGELQVVHKTSRKRKREMR